ncbi:MAG TPA: class I SAM-dependent methyltransferase [Acidimicrobiales bacterium]
MTDLTHPSFPLSSSYDADWLLSLDMGPNPLWLLEDLLRDMSILPGSRVLDLGSGRGATSVFLAKELGVEVWAADLWISPAVVEPMLRDLGLSGQVHPVQADARALPFEDGFFDVIVSIDAWEYFGTDDHFLPGLLRVLRPGGAIGMATPAMARDVRDLGAIPKHIEEVVGREALAWHSAEWWQQQWELTGLLSSVRARLQDGGWADWLRWAEETHARSGEHQSVDPVVEMGP